MGKINKVVVNGQNYEVEDKVARNYYPDTEQVAAIAEENSYKIVDKNGNVLAEFKSDSDISITLGGGGEENAILKLTKNGFKIIRNDFDDYLSLDSNDIYFKDANSKIRTIYSSKTVRYLVESQNNNGNTDLLLGVNNETKHSNSGNTLILGDSNKSNGIQNIVFGKNNYIGKSNETNYCFVFGNNNIIRKERNIVIGDNIDDADSQIEKRIILGYPVYFDVNGKTLQQRLDDLENKVAVLEKNSIKIISFDARNNEYLNSLTVNNVKYTNKEDIIEQLKQLKTCFIYTNGRPYHEYDVCLIHQDNTNANKIQIIEFKNPINTMIYFYYYTIDTNSLLVTLENKFITFED